MGFCRADIHEKFASGMNKTADLVRIAYGPQGRNVLFERTIWGGLQVTRDGALIAKATSYPDSLEETGNKILKMVGTMMSNQVGDGTSTAMIVTEALYQNLRQLMAAGYHPREIRLAVDQALITAGKQTGTIFANSILATSTEQVVQFISQVVRSETLARFLHEILEVSGKNGSIIVEESDRIDDSYHQTDGYHFERGLIDVRIPKNERGWAELKDPFILVSDYVFTKAEEIVPLLEVSNEYKQPILIVCSEIIGAAKKVLVSNVVQGRVQALAVKAPEFGLRRQEFLQDLAVYTNAKPFLAAEKREIKELHTKDFGQAGVVKMSDRQTFIIDGFGPDQKVISRVKEIKAQIAQSESLHDRDIAQKRISRLLGGLIVMKVGGATKSEICEKKTRVEDGLAAARSFMQYGGLKGGGRTLFDISCGFEKKGVAGALKKAFADPVRSLCLNADYVPALVMEDMAKTDQVFNFKTGLWCSAEESGIIELKQGVTLLIDLAISSSLNLLELGGAIVGKNSM